MAGNYSSICNTSLRKQHLEFVVLKFRIWNLEHIIMTNCPDEWLVSTLSYIHYMKGIYHQKWSWTIEQLRIVSERAAAMFGNTFRVGSNSVMFRHLFSSHFITWNTRKINANMASNSLPLVVNRPHPLLHSLSRPDVYYTQGGLIWTLVWRWATPVHVGQ